MLLALACSMDETMHLRVLAHARRELGTQVNEGLLRGGRCSCGWARLGAELELRRSGSSLGPSQ